MKTIHASKTVDTIIAALRLFQVTDPIPESILKTASYDGLREPLTSKEIDEVVEGIENGEVVIALSGDSELSGTELEVIHNLRGRGFAVIVWTPGELDGADADRVQDRSIELGWEVIHDLK